MDEKQKDNIFMHQQILIWAFKYTYYMYTKYINIPTYSYRKKLYMITKGQANEKLIDSTLQTKKLETINKQIMKIKIL